MSASAREVRKIVTILFCDLVHSTGLAEGDPEAYRRVQMRFFERMRDIVEQYGGTVEKFIGDEVMAVFGVPVVHEDDALRAVRAAQEMQKALPELGLQARIGINTGEVLAGDPSTGSDSSPASRSSSPSGSSKARGPVRSSSAGRRIRWSSTRLPPARWSGFL